MFDPDDPVNDDEPTALDDELLDEAQTNATEDSEVADEETAEDVDSSTSPLAEAEPALETTPMPAENLANLDTCTLSFVVQLLPDDGDSEGRLATVAVKASSARHPSFLPQMIRLRISELPAPMQVVLEHHRIACSQQPQPKTAETHTSKTKTPKPALKPKKRKFDLNAAPDDSPPAASKPIPTAMPAQPVPVSLSNPMPPPAIEVEQPQSALFQ